MVTMTTTFKNNGVLSGDPACDVRAKWYWWQSVKVSKRLNITASFHPTQRQDMPTPAITLHHNHPEWHISDSLTQLEPPITAGVVLKKKTKKKKQVSSHFPPCWAFNTSRVVFPKRKIIPYMSQLVSTTSPITLFFTCLVMSFSPGRIQNVILKLAKLRSVNL